MSLNSLTKLFAIILLPLLFTAVSCNKPTEPTDTPPGRRDYVWSVDTIPVKNSVMKDMWGSSPSDIWICGDGDDRRQSLWHYDGKSFNPYNEYIVSATSFCGFAQNNIWMSTAYGRIYHYDGFNWKIDSVFTMEGYDDVIIQQLCGTSPNNIYATGMAVNLDEYKGIILQYDGKKWTNLNIPNIPVNLYNIQYSREDNHFFLSGAHFDNSETSERLYTFSTLLVKFV
ncbi:MAG: hypothetical protein Q8K93_22415 [Reyranella sp.]|nr:hypothetical protein [Reyranella sp.]MDP2302147.1 hypothetical protein [Ignavibacteria bacterium]